MRLVTANQPVAGRRRVYFHLVGTDGITPALGEAGGQPQQSTNGSAWTVTGIGALVSVGNGRYYADLTQTAVANVGDRVETRYKSVTTAECPGDSVQVVAFDLDTAAAPAGDPLANALGGYAAGTAGGALQAISPGNITVVSPVSLTGQAVTIRAGDDYTGASALTWSSAAWPNLTGAAVTLQVPSLGLTFDGTATGPASVSVPLTAAQTASLAPGSYAADVVAVLASGAVRTLVSNLALTVTA